LKKLNWYSYLHNLTNQLWKKISGIVVIDLIFFNLTTACMPHNTYRALPLQALYELLLSSVRDMLAAYETQQDNMIAFKAMKKQVETLVQVIEEKRQGAFGKN